MKADLNDRDLDELDALLAQAPEALDPLGVVMLDGYLTAAAVQPRILTQDDWLPRALDTDGTRWPAVVDAAWLDRVASLTQRRYQAIVAGLQEERLFDPVVADAADDEREPAEPAPAEADAEEQAVAALPAHSRALYPWAAGFLYGLEVFDNALLDHPEDAVHLALARVLRHLPAVGEEERQMVADLDREQPLRDEDHAIADLVDAVADLWDLTSRERMAVRTVRREGAKVGRNDPCPCGSGRKFKACHGKN